MQTRFSLELPLFADEQLRLFQVFEYLIELESGNALVPRELANFLATGATEGDAPERRFNELIGRGEPGFEFVRTGVQSIRIYDTLGSPDLRMLGRIIANVLPRLLPLEFSFALLDEVEHHFSGGLVVMTSTRTDIQRVETLLRPRGGQLLH